MREHTECQRCEGRHGPLTRRIEWREVGDSEGWKNRVTYRCDSCASDLYDWLRVPRPSYADTRYVPEPGPRGSVERDEPVQP